jgi:membrane associated rhomboid family serine protease
MPMIFAAFVWVLIEFFGLSSPGNIAHGAHLGGLFFGLLCGYLIHSREKKLF